MPKTNGLNRLPYEVIRMGEPFKLRGLSLAEQKELRKIFDPHELKLYEPECKDHPDGCEPFFADYERCVRAYIQDVANVNEVTPAKVKKRINTVFKNAVVLLEAITDLEPTDKMLIGKFFTTRLLMGKKVAELNLPQFDGHF